ncbi:MAG: class I tRNA ligase family protein, partial [Sphingomicrobium sp.]
EATRAGEIKIVPETWSKTWFNWLENIQPWCVSRQLWWGHRIPAWFDDDGNIFVAESEAEARAEAGDRQLRQDEDVLDTWFSSALWPFATLGWPEQDTLSPAGRGQGEGELPPAILLDGRAPSSQPSPPRGEGAKSDLARHYPNDVLISGFDILFFWDARMAMQGMEFMKAVPWKTLYLHGLVRDANGAKMSKSKGNTVDPLGLIDQYGADALRFTMAAMESQGRDIKLDEKRVEGYRNFATKLWNAARFLQGNGVGASSSIAAPEAKLPVNRWIIGEVVATLEAMNKAVLDFRFDDMADAIYHFTWGTFCDWYVELIKGAWDDETKQVAAWAFDQILVMLHPLMPFITEELWSSMAAGERDHYPLITAKWPEPDATGDPAAAADVSALIDIIDQVRALRSELTIPWSAALIPHVIGGDAAIIERFTANAATLARMAKLGAPAVAENVPTGSAQIVIGGTTVAFPLGDAIDLDAEKARLAKAIAAATKDRDGLAARLANPAFTDRAKPEAVEKAREDHAARAAEADRLSAALARLG